MTVIAVTGSHYGGTSAIAGVVHLLGFPVDQGTSRANEDALVHKVKRDKLKFSELIASRNEAFGDWAFKIPNLTVPMIQWLHDKHNTKFVVVLRDPVAIATSHNKRPDSERVNKHAAGLLSKFQWMLAALAGKDVYYVSYERLLQDPVEEARHLASYLGVGVTPAQADMIYDYITQKHYLSVKEFIETYNEETK